jgi:hypothetical protein
VFGGTKSKYSSDGHGLAQSLKPAEAKPIAEPNKAVPTALEGLRPRLEVWKAVSHGLSRG